MTNHSKCEIERRFLVKNIPENLGQYTHFHIIQGYLAVEKNGPEVRLRQETLGRAAEPKYYMTIKNGSGLSRREVDSKVTKDLFETFWPETDGRRLEKIRYMIQCESIIIQFNLFINEELKGLMLVEVEFPSEAIAKQFKPLDWFGREVTDEPPFQSRSLAIEGRPYHRNVCPCS